MVYYDRLAHIIPSSQEEWYYNHGLMSHLSMPHYKADMEKRNSESIKESAETPNKLSISLDSPNRFLKPSDKKKFDIIPDEIELLKRYG
jgi:hypothetical protein